jgi:hypothetical protein
MSHFDPVSDDELLLFHYRDGLEPARLAEIEDALFHDADLRDRHRALQRTLAHVDAADLPMPDAGFEARLWRSLEPRIDTLARQPVRGTVRARWSDWMGTLAWPHAAFAAACVLVLAVGVGFQLGRREPVTPATVAVAQPANASAPARVLDAYVASHLRATEGLLLTASNSDSAAILAGNRDVAASLVDSNRLYALAAARSGDLRLADFLRRLEPILLDLANQAPDASIEDNEGLREYLRETDLIFQVRATQARMQAAEASPTRSRTGADA